jgi:hypothetical protein
MTEQPNFDIYPDVDREIKIAAEAKPEVPVDESGLDQAIHEEIGDISEEEQVDARITDLDPTQATTLDELKEILKNVNVAVVQHIMIKHGDSKAETTQESQDSRARIPSDQADVFARAESFARRGQFSDANMIIARDAASGTEDDMHRALDELVYGIAENFAKKGQFSDARRVISAHATSGTEARMEEALDLYVMSVAENFAKKGQFSDARRVISAYATSGSEPGMESALDMHVLTLAENFARKGQKSDARRIISAYATSGVDDVMVQVLDL